MTTQGAQSPTAIRFSIDGCQGILEARHIAEALHIPFQPEDPSQFKQWSPISQRDMVRILLRGTSGDSFLLHKELPSGMLLVGVLLRSNIFPLQHLVQRQGLILDALFRISEGFYFGPHYLIMAALLYFKEKVHRKKLQRADTIPLLFSRLLYHILEHLSYPTEPILSVATIVESISLSTNGHSWRDECPTEPIPSTPATLSMLQATSTDPPTTSSIPPAAPHPSQDFITISATEFRAMTQLFKTQTSTHNALFRQMTDIRTQQHLGLSPP
ncbi:hypothetical protein PVL29_014757 [Vitis rotundifolia]|uniref:Uncharacterized protein n=1 Tax=Vitis rotundifolia TaxID=103349 RepID=A0AA39DMS6_VITRO|nr:hypothetical protein PVL29_014757 [Vitis rotundifolia]